MAKGHNSGVKKVVKEIGKEPFTSRSSRFR